MPADGTLAAITPAEISASFPTQRQLTNKLHVQAAEAIKKTQLTKLNAPL